LSSHRVSAMACSQVPVKVAPRLRKREGACYRIVWILARSFASCSRVIALGYSPPFFFAARRAMRRAGSALQQLETRACGLPAHNGSLFILGLTHHAGRTGSEILRLRCAEDRKSFYLERASMQCRCIATNPQRSRTPARFHFRHATRTRLTMPT